MRRRPSAPAAFLVVAIMTAIAAPALAQPQDPPYAPEFGRCIEEAGGVTATTIECIGHEHDAWDGRLNTAYRAALGRLEEHRRAAFREAQRAWLAYRDRDCAFRADPEGGSIARIDGAFCMLRKTAWRTLELEGLVRELEIH